MILEGYFFQYQSRWKGLVLRYDAVYFGR